MSTTARRLSAAVTASALSALVLSAGLGVLPAHAASQQTTPAAASGSYTVKAGDTLSGIAVRHGVSLAAVFAANNMGLQTVIYPGQKIKVGAGVQAPAATRTPARASAPATRASAPASVTVKSGDTLSGIAARNGVSLTTILTANKLQLRSIIYPGQRILLGAEATTPQPATVSAAVTDISPVAAGTGTHIVQAGDTLSRIASAHGVSLSAVLAANGMNLQTVIYPGQTVRLDAAEPASPAPPRAPKHSSGTTSPSAAQLRSMVADTAQQMGVDPSLALAFAMQESSFRQGVVSSVGAVGTMQIMPSSGEWASQLVGRSLNLNDAADNITAGVAIISALIRTSPSTEIAVASYYQGQYSVQNIGMYEDTKAYVASVLNHQESFR